LRPRERGFWRGCNLACGLALAALGLLALLAPWISPDDPNRIDVGLRFAAPGAGQWLGRDALGRDLLSRIIGGARVSLPVGLIAALGLTALGTLLGAWAAYAGGWIDALIMRTADVLMSIPTLFLVLTLIVVLGPGLEDVVLVIVATGWTGMARLVRAEVLSLKEREFVLASRASGAHPARVLFRHVLPNALAPVYVALTFGVADAILMESGLSFLGLGVQPPTASWGSLLSDGRDSVGEAWWLVVFPGLAIFAVLLLVNHLGEAARRHFDPKALT
jgi:peptide/nickel transport system permease protein